MVNKMTNMRNSTAIRAKNVIEALTKISQAITSDQYLDDILKLIVTVTAGIMDSKICSLMLIENGELTVKATQSVSKRYNSKPNIKIGQGIAGNVAQTGRYLKVLDVREDERYLSRDVAQKENLCSLLSIPLAYKKKVIGVLNCYTDQPHDFPRNEIRILSAIANQASVVIENSKLIFESKVIQQELESRKIVERAKGILMILHGLNESQAYMQIRKYSMDKRKNMKEVAEAIILAEAIKTGK